MPNSTTTPKSFPGFPESFSTLADPRRTTRGNFKYPLEEILFLTISAAISDSTNWSQIHVFGESKLEWLRQYYPYKHGIPSEDVLSNLFARLDSEKFCACFMDWVGKRVKLQEGEVIAIDGKTACRSGDKQNGHPALHVVSAYASKHRVTLGQQKVNGKSNEITAIPALLDLLTIEKSMVSIDAMGCQKEIAAKIREKKADYILMVKGNQATLLDEIRAVFSSTPTAWQHTEEDFGHGRIETRSCKVVNDLRFLDERDNWKDLNSIIEIERKTTDKQTLKQAMQTSYYISSALHDAQKFNHDIRSHWSVENGLHWSLDVLFEEDRSLKKKGDSAINFNIIAKIALALIEKEPTQKRSRVQKMKKCALNDSFREKVLNL